MTKAPSFFCRPLSRQGTPTERVNADACRNKRHGNGLANTAAGAGHYCDTTGKGHAGREVTGSLLCSAPARHAA